MELAWIGSLLVENATITLTWRFAMGHDAYAKCGVLVPLEQVFAAIPDDRIERCGQRLRDAVYSEDAWCFDRSMSEEAAVVKLKEFAYSVHGNKEYLQAACGVIADTLLPIEEEPSDPSSGVGADFCNVLNELWMETQPDGMPPLLEWPRIDDIVVFYDKRMAGIERVCNKHYVVFSADDAFCSILTTRGTQLAEALKLSELTLDKWVEQSW